MPIRCLPAFLSSLIRSHLLSGGRDSNAPSRCLLPGRTHNQPRASLVACNSINLNKGRAGWFATLIDPSHSQLSVWLVLFQSLPPGRLPHKSSGRTNCVMNVTVQIKLSLEKAPCYYVPPHRPTLSIDIQNRYIPSYDDESVAFLDGIQKSPFLADKNTKFIFLFLYIFRQRRRLLFPSGCTSNCSQIERETHKKINSDNVSPKNSSVCHPSPSALFLLGAHSVRFSTGKQIPHTTNDDDWGIQPLSPIPLFCLLRLLLFLPKTRHAPRRVLDLCFCLLRRHFIAIVYPLVCSRSCSLCPIVVVVVVGAPDQTRPTTRQTARNPLCCMHLLQY